MKTKFRTLAKIKIISAKVPKRDFKLNPTPPQSESRSKPSFLLPQGSTTVSWGLHSLRGNLPGQALRMKKRGADEQRLKSARGREKSSDEIFVCERVCTSNRMLKK
ncbi:hypothetical protein OIU78_020302, partial [Salix suchowensis]